MADLLRLVTIDETYCPVFQQELENYFTNGIAKVRGSFHVSNAARTPVSSKVPGRFGGAYVQDDTMDSGTAGATWMVKGTSADDALSKLENFLSEADIPFGNDQAYLQWRPEGATKTTYIPLRGTPTYTITYAIEQFREYLLRADVSWPCAPLAEGLRMSFSDDWRARGLGLTDAAVTAQGWKHTGTWTFSTVAQGDLRMPTGVTGQQGVIWNDSREPAVDQEVIVQGSQATGASVVVSLEAGIKYQVADGKYVYATLNTSTGALEIRQWDGSTAQLRATSTTNIVGNTTVTVPTIGTTYWIGCRSEGNIIVAELWTTEPAGQGNLPVITTTWWSADAQSFGTTRAGFPVLNVTPSLVTGVKSWGSARVSSFQYRGAINSTPGANGGHVTPREKLVPAIPGTAPASVDFELSNTNASLPANFQAVGWRAYSPGIGSLGTNEQQQVTITGSPTGGTFTLKLENINVGTQNIPFNATADQFRSAITGGILDVDDVVVTGGPLPGTPIVMTFVGLELGARDVAQWTLNVNSLTGGTTPTVTVTTPTAGVFAPSAKTLYIDRPPTNTGFTVGAAPAYSQATTNTYKRNNHLVWTSNAAGLSASFAAFDIDPTILQPDPFSKNCLLTIFCRAQQTVIPTPAFTIVASLYPQGQPLFGRQYTIEYGTTGYTLPQTFSANNFRIFNLGTLAFPATTTSPVTLELSVTQGATGSGSLDMDWLMLMPAQRSWSSPTGKDFTDPTYPSFQPSTSPLGTRRIVYSDLSAALAAPTLSAVPTPNPAGIGGTPFEVDPGPTVMQLIDSNVTPNDVNTTATSVQDPVTARYMFQFAVTPRYRLAAF